jgi:alcohol dehydrogenase, propanol-preferring
MRAWVVDDPGPMATGPLRPVEREVPEPGPGEIRVRVSACGVCRTDLHLAEGDLAPRRPGVVPGHEAVGTVDLCGPGSRRFEIGARVGVPWLRRTCGRCRFCRSGRENLCLTPEFTAWDADGGFAEYCTVPEAFAYDLADLDGVFDDEHAAPLLCAGIIGYRALRLSGARDGSVLGIYGFGASAHLAAQVAVHLGARVHVMTRDPDAQARALALGASSAQGAADPPPEPLDAAVLFAPVGALVPPALEALDRGGTLAIAGIHLTDVPSLVYQRHLFHERTVRSVTANTREDGRAFLRLAAAIPIRVTTTPFPLAEADQALAALAADRIHGAGVLLNPPQAGTGEQVIP